MVVLACCFIATAVPFFINKYGFHLPLPTDTTARGTCRISPGFHVDCLPDFSSTAVVSLAAQQECERRFCCWDNSTGFYERQHFNTKIISTLFPDAPCYQRLPTYDYSSKIENISPDTFSGLLKNKHLLDGETSTHSYHIVPGSLPGHVTINIGDATSMEKTRQEANNLTINVGCPGFQGSDKNPQENCQNSIFTFEIGKTQTKFYINIRCH